MAIMAIIPSDKDRLHLSWADGMDPNQAIAL